MFSPPSYPTVYLSSICACMCICICVLISIIYHQTLYIYGLSSVFVIYLSVMYLLSMYLLYIFYVALFLSIHVVINYPYINHSQKNVSISSVLCNYPTS